MMIHVSGIKTANQNKAYMVARSVQVLTLIFLPPKQGIVKGFVKWNVSSNIHFYGDTREQGWIVNSTTVGHL